MNRNGRTPKNKLFIRIVLAILILLFAAMGYIWLYKKYQIYQFKRGLHQTYETRIKPLVPQAVQNLQNNQNDWLVCTDLGLNLDNIGDPQVMAQWIAYYRYGQEYCKQWWDWPGDPCKIMAQHKIEKNDDLFLLERKITLCEIAKEIK